QEGLYSPGAPRKTRLRSAQRRCSRTGSAADYASYTSSFIKIADPRIKQAVESGLDAGMFWPEPLLQLNPTFLPGGTIDDFVADGTLHPECSKIFRIEKSDTDLTG